MRRFTVPVESIGLSVIAVCDLDVWTPAVEVLSPIERVASLLVGCTFDGQPFGPQPLDRPGFWTEVVRHFREIRPDLGVPPDAPITDADRREHYCMGWRGVLGEMPFFFTLDLDRALCAAIRSELERQRTILRLPARGALPTA